jgi:hypothetical protein
MKVQFRIKETSNVEKKTLLVVISEKYQLYSANIFFFKHLMGRSLKLDLGYHLPEP